jgi:hypothetical protein
MTPLPIARTGRDQIAGPLQYRSEPIVGYRAWRIRIEARRSRNWVPVLTSLTAGTDWLTADLVATCDGRLGRRRHPPGTRLPALDCSCGIYALSMPGGATGAGHPMVATGRVLLTGRVIEGRRGYRAERGRITGPLSVTLRCAHARCVDEPVFATRVLGAPRPVCLCHLTLEPRVERVATLDEFGRALCSRLELRYGVEVGADRSKEAAQWT